MVRPPDSLPVAPPFPGAVLATSCLFHGTHRAGVVTRMEPTLFGIQVFHQPIFIMCMPMCGARLVWVPEDRVSDCECRLA